jgi:hypothetical protein
MTATDKLNRMWKEEAIHSQYLSEGTEQNHINQFLTGLQNYSGSARSYISTFFLGICSIKPGNFTRLLQIKFRIGKLQKTSCYIKCVI